MERYAKTGERDVDTVLRGIDEIDTRAESDREMRFAQMHELVLSLSESHKSEEEIINILGELSPKSEMRNSVSAVERTALCREFLKLFPDSLGFDKDLFFGTTEALSENAEGKIEYVANRYTDNAYRRFSAHIGCDKGIAVRSFEELCENVYNGNSEFGILPIENTENGKLAHFYSLINKYELKIVAVCSIETSDAGISRFALIAKSIDYPHSRFGPPDKLELFITLEKNESLSEILAAAEFCKMELYRIDSLPLSSHSGKYALCPIFNLNESDINSFLMFMSLDFPQYTPVGIFKDIK